MVSGVPTQTGTFTFTANVTDNQGCTGSASISLTINCETITVTPPATNTGTAGSAFSQSFSQSGGIGTTNFSTTSTLPTGITLSTAGVLAGTPTQTGSFPITVKATDSNGCMGTTNYTLTINCQTITVTAPATAARPAQTAVIYQDILIVRVGRALANFGFLNPVKPLPEQGELVDAVVGRLQDALG